MFAKAEQQLLPRTPKIGVAKAAYFPQFPLSGTAGFQSAALTTLFSGPRGTWDFGASLAHAILPQGRLRSNVRLRASPAASLAAFSIQQFKAPFAASRCIDRIP